MTRTAIYDNWVTVIIPAFNEESRIQTVLSAALACETVQEVIVVSDGSTDRTPEIAESFGVRTERLPRNVGKGGAMLHGASCAERADILVFLDADLIGIKPEHIDALVGPVAANRSAMAIGQFVGGRGVTDLAQLLVKCISGQRAIRRDLFMSIPSVDTVGYGVEMLITLHVSGLRLATTVVPLRGVTHPMKEEKLGLLHGFYARAHMYLQMARFWASYHFGGAPAVLTEVRYDTHAVIRNGSSQDQAVDAVQNAPMAR